MYRSSQDDQSTRRFLSDILDGEPSRPVPFRSTTWRFPGHLREAKHVRSPGMPKCVLVVEDDPDIAELEQVVLEGAGYDVYVTMGTATLTAVHNHRPDVVLLDNNMPGMSGIEIANQLHSDPATREVPIVAVTAADQMAVICRRMHADGCLGKPFEIDDLVEVVHEYAYAGHQS